MRKKPWSALMFRLLLNDSISLRGADAMLRATFFSPPKTLGGRGGGLIAIIETADLYGFRVHPDRYCFALTSEVRKLAPHLSNAHQVLQKTDCGSALVWVRHSASPHNRRPPPPFSHSDVVHLAQLKGIEIGDWTTFSCWALNEYTQLYNCTMTAWLELWSGWVHNSEE